MQRCTGDNSSVYFCLCGQRAGCNSGLCDKTIPVTVSTGGKK